MKLRLRLAAILLLAVAANAGARGLAPEAQALVAAATAAALFVYFDRAVLQRLAKISRDLGDVEAGRMPNVPVIADAKDEVRGLADAVNRLIAATAERDETHRRSVAYARAILDAIPGHVSWVSRELKYLGVNDSLAKAHGVPNADFVGKDVGFLEGRSGALRDFLEDFFALEEEHAQVEIGGDPDDANARIFLVSGQKYNGGREAVLVGVDVTDRRRLARQVDLERQRALHASKMSTLGEMAGGIAHEINNPVTIIYGKAKQIQKFQDLPDYKEFAAKSAGQIEATAMRIAKIVKGLRTFARDGDKDPFEPTPVVGLIDDAVALCEMRLRERGVDLTIAPIPDGLAIECRPTQVSQVLLNLIGNAQDAIASLTERWVRIGARDAGACVELSVEDSGVGIPEAIATRIFNPFFTTKDVGKGTGLGLSISRGIAESHGGKLGLDRTCPHTRFILVLPKKQDADAEMRKPGPFFRAS